MFLAVALDMGGQMGIRDIVLPACAAMLIGIRRVAFPRRFAPLFFLLVLYPTALLAVGVLKNADLSVAVSQYRSTVLAFLLLVILSDSSYETLARALYASIGFTALVAVVLAVSLSLDLRVFDDLIRGLHEDSAGYFGMREVGESFVPNIYFTVTLFYVPAALYFLYGGRHLPFLACLAGLIAAVSKAGMVFVLLGAVVFLLKKGKPASKLVVGAAVCIVILFVFQSPVMKLFFEIQEGRSGTVEARVGHLVSISRLFSDHPLGFFFGFGLGTEFYSEGFGQYVWNIELDHLNCIRKYGFLWSCVFFGVVLQAAFRAVRSEIPGVRVLGVCLLSAFVVAGTNPVLISPVFFLILFVTMLANLQSASRGDPDAQPEIP